VLRVVSGCFVACGRNCGSWLRSVDPAITIVGSGAGRLQSDDLRVVNSHELAFICQHKQSNSLRNSNEGEALIPSPCPRIVTSYRPISHRYGTVGSPSLPGCFTQTLSEPGHPSPGDHGVALQPASIVASPAGTVRGGSRWPMRRPSAFSALVAGSSRSSSNRVKQPELARSLLITRSEEEDRQCSPSWDTSRWER